MPDLVARLAEFKSKEKGNKKMVERGGRKENEGGGLKAREREKKTNI